MATPRQEPPWTLDVTPRSAWFTLNLGKIWRYRDLLTLFVKRDIVTFYKQTILGPLWFLLQPLFTTAIFIVIFQKVAQISTADVPPVLFYLSGIIVWNYFAECVKATTTAFTDNEHIFGKVYFPRVLVPLATIISNLVRFSIQFGLFLVVMGWFWWQEGEAFVMKLELLPLALGLILLTAGFSLGIGLIVSSLTTKYRDLSFLITFGIQLAMYATPVIYPLAEAPEVIRNIIIFNPMAPIIEAFRYIFLGAGTLSWPALAYSLGAVVVVMLLGLLIFNRTEKTFMDTV
jgi:lipopolysaccharide transport system permease protein